MHLTSLWKIKGRDQIEPALTCKSNAIIALLLAQARDSAVAKENDHLARIAVDIVTKGPGIVTNIGRDLTFPTGLAALALQMFVMTAAAHVGRDDDVSVARMIAGLAVLELLHAG